MGVNGLEKGHRYVVVDTISLELSIGAEECCREMYGRQALKEPSSLVLLVHIGIKEWHVADIFPLRRQMTVPPPADLGVRLKLSHVCFSGKWLTIGDERSFDLNLLEGMDKTSRALCSSIEGAARLRAEQ